MAKEVMILNAEEIKMPAALTAEALAAYKFAVENAGINMDDDGAVADFVNARNLKANGFRDLWECKSWFDKFSASIKEVEMHAFNVGGEEDLPANVKWAKQSYTYEFMGDAGVLIADTLIKKHLVTKEQLFQQLSVANVLKASGLTLDKLVDMFPDTVLAKPKARTLNIK